MKSIKSMLVAMVLLSLCIGIWGQESHTRTAQRRTATQQITADQADAILQELHAIRQLLEQQKNDAIANELRQIRQVMERQQQVPAAPQGAANQPAPSPTKINLKLDNAPALGSSNAQLVLVEFSDYQCPFCRAFHESAFQEIKKNLIDQGKVRFMSRDLPLEFHDHALKSAQAAQCAGEQNKFWEMRDLLIRNASDLSSAALLRYATQLGLKMDDFGTCVSGEKYLAEIRTHASEANALGISGTPTFVVGKVKGDQLEGVVLVGAQPYSFFEQQINKLLSGSE
jgi:protein-disulfide isomerase